MSHGTLDYFYLPFLFTFSSINTFMLFLVQLKRTLKIEMDKKVSIFKQDDLNLKKKLPASLGSPFFKIMITRLTHFIKIRAQFLL